MKSPRQLGLIAAGRVSAHVPRLLERVVWRTVERFRLMPVRLLTGLSPSGQTASMLVVGASPQVDFLPDHFFDAAPESRLLGQYRPAEILPLLSQWPDCTLTVARVDQALARRWAQAGFLRLPYRIGAMLEVPDLPFHLTHRNRSLASDLNRLRRQHFETWETKSPVELRRFYDTMYLPTCRMRYADRRVVRPRHSLERVQREGGLVYIQQEGRDIAGFVYSRQGTCLHCVSLGISSDPRDREFVRSHGSVYLKVIELAHRFGCQEVFLGGSNPSLHDGALRYKRKWGAKLMENRDTYHDLCVRWHTATPALLECLDNNALIVRDGPGFTALTTETSKLKPTQLTMPGLRRFQIVSIGSGCRLD